MRRQKPQDSKEKLAAARMRLNMTKCMKNTPSVAPPGMEDWWEQTTKGHDGFIIAGRPYSIEEESLERVGTVFPVGENKFQEEHKWDSQRDKRPTCYCTTAPQRKRRTS